MGKLLTRQILDLDQEIRRLRSVAEKVLQLSLGVPTAEANAYMILRHIEMLESEISDLVSAMSGKVEGKEG